MTDNHDLDEMAVRALVRRSMQPEINRIALGHWWHSWLLRDCRTMALTELRRVLVLVRVLKPDPTFTEAADTAWLADRPVGDVITEMVTDRAPDRRWRHFAFDMLDVEIDAMGERHGESIALAQAAALQALQNGMSRRAVATAAVEVARGRVPPLPPQMTRDAIEAAAREFRFAAHFWRKRERVG